MFSYYFYTIRKQQQINFSFFLPKWVFFSYYLYGFFYVHIKYDRWKSALLSYSPFYACFFFNFAYVWIGYFIFYYFSYQLFYIHLFCKVASFLCNLHQLFLELLYWIVDIFFHTSTNFFFYWIYFTFEISINPFFKLKMASSNVILMYNREY